MASYLDTPRVYFSGHFRADAQTVNNLQCNFDVDVNFDTNLNEDWNSLGTNEFSFLDTKVTGAVDKEGVFTESDSVIGAKVLDNGKSPFAKMVIQDVDTENTTAVYGMKFAIGWNQTQEGYQNLSFKGDWTRNIISQNLWHKVKCYNASLLQDTYPRGALATTTITNISWDAENDHNSNILKDLREASIANGNTLQVSVSFYFYTRNYQPLVTYNFTLGYVIGSIGIYIEGEPLNYGGDRLLSPENISTPQLEFSDNDSCAGLDPDLFKPWMYRAPFKVHTSSSVVTVDLSNALPITTYSNMRDIGPLFLAIIHEKIQCVELISSDRIPYLSENWIKKTGGVVDYKLSSTQLDNLKSNYTLVVVREQSTSENTDTYPECGQKALHLQDDEHVYKLMLRESPYYIRPMGFYNAFREFKESVEIPLYVSHLGNPANNIKVIVSKYVGIYLSTTPEFGVTVEGSDHAIKTTNSAGLASFTYTVAKPMSTLRKYSKSPCAENQPQITTIPIDGQNYQFIYAVCTTDECPKYLENDLDITKISIRALSSNTATEPYSWDDVYPIFRQYYHLYPVMSRIVNLTNYYSIIEYHNWRMINYSMSLDFNDPNFMPVTRDIPPSKQKMILKWLQNPIRKKNDLSFSPSDVDDNPSQEVLEVPLCDHPNTTTAQSNFDNQVFPLICQHDKIPFDTNQVCDFLDANYYRATLDSSDTPDCTRPLYGYTSNSQNPNIRKLCNITNVQEQLQLAVEIEFATIPLYLTSLYSIVKGCNPEIYHLIRSVVMQEMLHLVQVANILIATGETPIVDNPSFVPQYPREGLPGCVHPKLKVYLDKFNLKQVHDVFLTIEQPNITCIATPRPELANNTIGQFYNEIEECIETLGNDIFKEGAEQLQVNWPWPLLPNTVGKVHIVTDVNSSKAGIDEIVKQGEGSSPIDPNYDPKTDQLAHYYRFQEIVCRRKLIKVDDEHYAYRGPKISYDPQGVWPMRKHPGKGGIFPGTNCYTEAKAFHKVFRALLRELQVTFGGSPTKIINTVKLMESLLVHAKRVMRVKYKFNDKVDDDTCGPVWDYDWDD